MRNPAFVFRLTRLLHGRDRNSATQIYQILPKRQYRPSIAAVIATSFNHAINGESGRSAAPAGPHRNPRHRSNGPEQLVLDDGRLA
jgi:hypothetical protein